MSDEIPDVIRNAVFAYTYWANGHKGYFAVIEPGIYIGFMRGRQVGPRAKAMPVLRQLNIIAGREPKTEGELKNFSSEILRDDSNDDT